MFDQVKNEKIDFDFFYKKARQTGTLNLNNKMIKDVPTNLWKVNEYKWESKNEECKWWELLRVNTINLSFNLISELQEIDYNKLVPDLK